MRSFFRVFTFPVLTVYVCCCFSASAEVANSYKKGGRLFGINWTQDDGFGHGKGESPFDAATGGVSLGFEMISAPTVNSCAACHHQPFGEPGGSSQIVTSIIVAGGMLDSMVPKDSPARKSSRPLDAIVNLNASTGAYGAGFVDVLGRQMTARLRAIRDSVEPGQSAELVAKGVDFGILAREEDGRWDTSGVEGLRAGSLRSSGADDPPELTVRPFHQVGAVASLREFTVNAFDFHLGMQAVERFGRDTDPDGDGVENELSVEQITAITIFQAAMPVPGRVIPSDLDIERKVFEGERLFSQIGCANCHIPSLPLDERGWEYTEPNPYHGNGNLQADKPVAMLDLTSNSLPSPRLKADKSVVHVPAYTDFKLHDITSGPDDPDHDPLNMHVRFGSERFFKGESKFLTARLWGFSNQLPYFHNGRYTTIRGAVLAHAGEAAESTDRFRGLGQDEQASLIEFLKTLQVLPPGTRHRIVDENGNRKQWPPPDSAAIE